MRQIFSSLFAWRTRFLAALFAVSAGPGAQPVRAHDPGTSESVFTLRPGRVEIQATFSWADIHEMIPIDADEDGKLQPGEFSSMQEDLIALGTLFFSIQDESGELLELSDSDVSVSAADPRELVFVFEYAAPRSAEWKSIDVGFDAFEDFPGGHLHLLEVRTEDGILVDRHLLNGHHSEAWTDVSDAPPPDPAESVGSLRPVGAGNSLDGEPAMALPRAPPVRSQAWLLVAISLSVAGLMLFWIFRPDAAPVVI